MLFPPLVLFLLELLDCIINVIILREVCPQQADNQTSLHPNLPPTFHILQCLPEETQRRHLPCRTYPPLLLLPTTKKFLNINLILQSNGPSQQQILSIKVIMLPHGKRLHCIHHTMHLGQMWVWEGVQNPFHKTIPIKMNTYMMLPVKVYPGHSHNTAHTKYQGLLTITHP